MLSLATDAFMVGVAAGFMLLVIAVAGAAYAFTRMRPSWRLFYVAWLGAMLLAFVLPLVIAAAVTSDAAGLDAMCARRVRNNITRETVYQALPFPIEVREAVCPEDTLSEPTMGSIIVRGPYGIAIHEGSLSGGSTNHPNERGAEWALLILFAGAGLVSIPFATVALYSQARRLRLAVA